MGEGRGDGGWCSGTVTFTEAFQKDGFLRELYDSSDHNKALIFVIGNTLAFQTTCHAGRI